MSHYDQDLAVMDGQINIFQGNFVTVMAMEVVNPDHGFCGLIVVHVYEATNRGCLNSFRQPCSLFPSNTGPQGKAGN
jgi:hypothetical protein